MFRLAVVLAAVCASAFGLPFGIFQDEATPEKTCSMRPWNPEESAGVYQGRLMLAGLMGILGSECSVDESVLIGAELRYVKKLDDLLKQALPGGHCHPDTFAKTVYQAFAKVSVSPPEVEAIEKKLMTQWCNGKEPTDKQISDLNTLKKALNLLGGDNLVNGMACIC